ncbi:MAG: hypothetical protein AB8G23_11895 [Myxococcota bacterium]
MNSPAPAPENSMTCRRTPAVSLINLIALCIASFALVGPAIAQQALRLDFNSELGFVATDTGSGTLTGGTPGVTTFRGNIDYFDACGQDCIADTSDPSDVTYSFSSGTGSFDGLGVQLSADSIRIGIVDQDVIDPEIRDFAALLGLTVSVGQTFDLWAARASSSVAGGASEVEWSVIHLYVSSNPINGVAYQAIPPAGADLVVLEVEESASADLYLALGSATAVLQGTDCQPGSIGLAGMCEACPAGSFSATQNAIACTPCPEGFASGPGASSCTTCDSGTVAPGTGNTVCTNCSPGTSSIAGSGACFECDAGSANPASGGMCEICPVGTIAMSSGTTECSVCPADFFASTPGSTICDACPPGETSAPGSASCQVPPPVPMMGVMGRWLLLLCGWGVPAAILGRRYA